MCYSQFGLFIFLTKLWTLGILFSTTVREALVAKLVILVISLLTSFILALRVDLVATLAIWSISSSVFFSWHYIHRF